MSRTVVHLPIEFEILYRNEAYTASSWSTPQTACQSRARQRRMALNEDLITCKRCLKRLEAFEAEEQHEAAQRYEEKIRRPLTPEQRAAIDRFLAAPPCSDPAPFLEGRTCDLREGHGRYHEVRVRVADRGIDTTIEWR